MATQTNPGTPDASAASATSGKPATGTPSKGGAVKSTISMLAMTVMIITTVLSLRGLASQAEFGVTSIFYYIFAALVFLIPFSLVIAELASTYTNSGGLYRWVCEGLGARWGWAAMYLEWQTIVIWFPSVLMFASVSLAYIFWPEAFDARLASNKLYSIIVLLAVYWLATLNTFRGMKSANKLSTLGGLFGTIIPGAILIILGVIYVCLGKPIEITGEGLQFFPSFKSFGTIVLAASIFLFYGGMEMQGVHIQAMKNPAKDFPKSVLLATIAILIIFICATMAIAFVVPQKDINLLQTLFVAYKSLWGAIGVPWIGNIMAALVTFGVIGQVSVIIAGPSTGLVAVAKGGYLPRGLQKENKNGINVRILLVQGIFVTILTLVLVILPSVEAAYQILSQMATIIYLLMVIIIYVACIRLRYTAPNKIRPYKVPGGKFGIWFFTILGLAGALLALILSFIPPSQITTGSPAAYVIILIIGSAVFFVIPFIVYALRKPTWRDPKTTFVPFDWQIEGRKAGEKSKWVAGYEPTEAEIQAVLDKENKV